MNNLDLFHAYFEFMNNLNFFHTYNATRKKYEGLQIQTRSICFQAQTPSSST